MAVQHWPGTGWSGLRLEGYHAMADLTQGLLAAGFKAGRERLLCLVRALRSADFDVLEDLECASR